MTPLELLWNGWRATYVTSAGAAGGVIPWKTTRQRPGECLLPHPRRPLWPRVTRGIIHRASDVFAVILKAYAFLYAIEHMLAPACNREVGHLEVTMPEETADLWATVTYAVVRSRPRSGRGRQRRRQPRPPAGGSVSEHLHVHVVPRWTAMPTS